MSADHPPTRIFQTILYTTSLPFSRFSCFSYFFLEKLVFQSFFWFFNNISLVFPVVLECFVDWAGCFYTLFLFCKQSPERFLKRKKGLPALSQNEFLEYKIPYAIYFKFYLCVCVPVLPVCFLWCRYALLTCVCVVSVYVYASRYIE